MKETYALKITQRGVGPEGESVSIYVGAFTYSELLPYVQVDRWSPVNEKGYQRPPIDRRLREVAKYVLEEQGILPTSVLLATRPEEAGVEFETIEVMGPTIEWGKLTIRNEATLWIVDAQHRYFGLQRAHEKTGGQTELEEYPFPVSIMESVDRYQEMNPLQYH